MSLTSIAEDWVLSYLCTRRHRSFGGDIKLAHRGNHKRELLQITRFVTLFEIFDTADHAIASFEKAAAANS
jgi:hypothetical protein